MTKPITKKMVAEHTREPEVAFTVECANCGWAVRGEGETVTQARASVMSQVAGVWFESGGAMFCDEECATEYV